MTVPQFPLDVPSLLTRLYGDGFSLGEMETALFFVVRMPAFVLWNSKPCAGCSNGFLSAQVTFY
jgi:hypothetical protein